MSRVSSEEQLHFLLNCVKHSNNGKVDFTAVAQDCGIISKGAAAKRYERMMKANGINPNGNGGSPGSQTPSAGPSPAKGTPATKVAKGTAKKRKAAGPNTPSKKGKLSQESDVENGAAPAVKGEGDNEDDFFSGGGMYKSANNPDPMLSQTAAEAANQDAAALFNEFCHPIDSEVETKAKKSRRTKRGPKKEVESDVEGGDVEVIFKEEPEVIG
ncbi:hypothetical protein FQN54_007750 [Arachnomyces sp. PD_36]|nr:hypothetical protein FQN54_007750 [Arachnomyces sp. PD_36]